VWGPDGWALFDTLVVSSSVFLLFIDSGGQGGNSWIKQMRVLRAFRLLRLLGKMGDLKKIISAVAMSLIPTLQALVSQQRQADPSNRVHQRLQQAIVYKYGIK
jgi:hypothetical protein